MVVFTPVDSVAIFKPTTGNGFGLGIKTELLAYHKDLKSPSFEPREPVKLKNGTGTGIGMLIPTDRYQFHLEYTCYCTTLCKQTNAIAKWIGINQAQ